MKILFAALILLCGCQEKANFSGKATSLESG